MAERISGQFDYPYQLEFGEGVDPFDLLYRIDFSESPDKAKFEQSISEWSDKAYEDGIHYVDDFIWGEQDMSLEFSVDYGSASDETIQSMFDLIAKFSLVRRVRVGTGFEEE